MVCTVCKRVQRTCKGNMLQVLPPELVEHIWEYLEHDKSARRPICRALLPLTRRALFNRVSLPTTKRLSRYMRLTHSPPYRNRVGEYIRELYLPAVNANEVGRPNSATTTTFQQSQKELKATLFAASHVEDLTLEGSAALKVLLPADKRRFNLIDLKMLTLSDLDAQHVPLFDMSHLSNLRAFPKLDTLSMYIEQGSEERMSNAKILRKPPFLQIKHLNLTAGMSLSTSSAANFLSHFTRLTSLDLTLNDLAEVTLLLRAVPSTLLTLSIEFDSDLEWEPNDSGIVVDQHLASNQFRRLKTLSLGRKTYSSGLFSILTSSLPALKRLCLDIDDFQLDASLILRYLHILGKKKPKSLKSLNLYGPYVCVDMIPSEHPERESVENGTLEIADWWSLPTWTREFTLEQAKEIVSTAAEVGVKLEGVLEEAIEVEELRKREERYLRDRADEIYESLAALFDETLAGLGEDDEEKLGSSFAMR